MDKDGWPDEGTETEASRRERSMSDSEMRISTPPRQLIMRPVFDHNIYPKKQVYGVWWLEGASVDGAFLPEKLIERSIFAKRLTHLGYGNRNVFRDGTLEFIHSAERLIEPSHIDFILDTQTWNFLMASWVKASDEEPKFDFNLSVYIRETIQKRRKKVIMEPLRTKHLAEYGREMLKKHGAPMNLML